MNTHHTIVPPLKLRSQNYQLQLPTQATLQPRRLSQKQRQLQLPSPQQQPQQHVQIPTIHIRTIPTIDMGLNTEEVDIAHKFKVFAS